MYQLDDIKEIARCVNLHYCSEEIRDIFRSLYSKTLNSYSNLMIKRMRFNESMEEYFSRSYQKCNVDVVSYYKAFKEFINNFSDLSHLAYGINSKKFGISIQEI